MKKADDSNGHIQQIDLERIHASPTNPRKTFNADSLKDLAETIKSQGVLQPILLRPMPGWELTPGGGSNGDGKGYRKGFLWENRELKLLGGFVDKKADGETTRPLEIVAGERRFRAAKLAGLGTIPAIVRDMTDRQVLEIQMIENEQREDVLPSERAAAYRRLAKSGTPAEAIAAQIGKSVSSVRDLLKVADRLQLPAAEALDAGKLPLSVAVLLARIPGEQAREKATAEVLKGNWSTGNEPLSYRDAKSLIERTYTVELKQATFDQADKKLLPSAGSCKTCPKRVGNLAKEDPEGYAGSRADVCTDPECFRSKKGAHLAREQARLLREGVTFSDQPSWKLHQTHVRIDEESHEIRTEEELEAAAEEKLPTWSEVLGGKLDKERVATMDEHSGTVTVWVPKLKALEIAAPEKAAEEAKEQAAEAKRQEGPSEWQVGDRMKKLAQGKVLGAMTGYCRGQRFTPGLGQVLNLLAACLADEDYLDNGDESAALYARHGIPVKVDVDVGTVEEEIKQVHAWLDNDAAADQALMLAVDLVVSRALSSGWHRREEQGVVRDLFAMANVDEKALEKEAKAILKAEAKAKKGKPQSMRQEMEGDDAPEETDEPAPQASQIPDLEVKDIEDVGLTREQLDAAYIGDKFGHKVLTGPITVKPVTIMGTLYVSSGSAGTATNLVWDLLPLRLARAFVIDSVYLDIPTKWQPNGDREHGWYAGVCVKVGKTEYAIGPDSEGRKVSWQGEPAESEAAHA